MPAQAPLQPEPAGASLATPEGYWPRRFTLIGLCFASTFLCYIDRVNISVAIIPMAEEYGWDPTTRGLVLSSFFWGYLATQLPGGWLADRFGGKAVLALGVLWWSLFTMLTPPAAAFGFATLFAARVLLGLGEGVNFPAVFSLFGRWVPPAERGRAGALNYSGISLGTVVALLVTPVIVAALGWRSVFYLYGALGFVWFVAWQWRVTNEPDRHPTIHPAELRHIRDGASSAPPRVDSIPWRRLLSKPAVWALVFNHFCANWGFYMVLMWLPSYFNEALGVNVASVGLFSFLPFVAMFITGNAAGWLADAWVRRGASVTTVRKTMQSIGMLGPAACFVFAGSVETPTQGLVMVVSALTLGAFSLAGFAVNHLDIAPRYAGTLLGLTNTAGTLPGIVAVSLTGVLVQTTGTWATGFLVAAGVYVLGAAVWLLFATGERVFD